MLFCSLGTRIVMRLLCMLLKIQYTCRVNLLTYKSPEIFLQGHQYIQKKHKLWINKEENSHFYPKVLQSRYNKISWKAERMMEIGINKHLSTLRHFYCLVHCCMNLSMFLFIISPSKRLSITCFMLYKVQKTLFKYISRFNLDQVEISNLF